MSTFPETHFLPFPGRCGDGYYGCQKPATHHLYAPDGIPVPGSSCCEACATRIATEYREKLDEHWRVIPISTTWPQPEPPAQADVAP